MALLLGVAGQAWAQEFRTWTDATGRFSLQAKFVSLEGGNVTLLRDSGGKVTIPLDKLSEADREHVASLQSENPFMPAEENPFTPAPASASPAGDSASGAPREVKVNWIRARPIALQASRDEWEITPPAAPKDYSPQSVAIPPKSDFFEKLRSVVVNPAANKAVLGYTLDHRKQKTTRLVLCDLARGQTVSTVSTEGLMIPLALHDSGRYVLMRRSEFGFGNSDRLEIWSIDGNSIAKQIAWTPYDEARGGGRDVKWAEFLDSETLATVNGGGKVVLWRFATATPICFFESTKDAIPAVSADRKWIAFAGKDSMGLFDVEQRKVAVVQNTPGNLMQPQVAFSPSGGKIACVAQGRVLVWDTATGQLQQDFKPAGISLRGGLDFPHDDFILASDQYLIALDSQLKLWSYEGAADARTVWGATFFTVSPHNKGGVLLAAKTPHPAALTMLDQALNQPDLFVFHEGVPVNLNVSEIPASHQEQVAEWLAQKLVAMNCSVESSAPLELTASVEGPKEKTVRSFHSGEYKVQEYRTKLAFSYQDKPVWATSGTNIPHFIRLGKGENIEGVLREKSKEPAYSFYERVTLPQLLQKPASDESGGGQTLGSSQVSPQGLR